MKDLTEATVSKWLKAIVREPEAYKNKCGTVTAVVGSVGMAGAAILCGRAALRCGCGLLQYSIPANIRDILQISVPEATCRERCITDELLSSESLAVGSGLGYNKEDSSFLKTLLSEYRNVMVLDADGLNDIVRFGLETELKETACDVVITPHLGEAARLLHSERITNREEAVRELRERYRVTAILKGHDTLIAPYPNKASGGTAASEVAEETVLKNVETGNPGMATGGSGDVLTGTIASLAAQGLSPQRAAACGVYIHGAAGDLASNEKGEHGVIASDIAEALPYAMKRLLNK